ncbi:pilM: type IV pilus assembly protein PilM [Gaiella occulta]|uniref:PilM: type IV pilus assembly protein PilM n=1 Tax=Gaiella occulta TaxID=1002870 RepID=A0A7M2YTU1_9ACTN|nr:type IV pilus assembly protein PilM [Gaiella occulta]RDI73561.1 pilM: type IV pilus assembly protein PilM [Gaiella occulta]
MIWNPRNVLSGRDDAAVPSSGPAPGFDPHRTGDPVEPGSTRPSIGFGDTRALPAPGESRRRPIGFAPSEQDVDHEPRFRTELSFKRHGGVPRADTTPRISAGGGEEAPAPWQTAGSAEHDDAERAGIAEPEAAVAAEKVPFYKRELSFRRRRGAPDVGAGAAAAGEPVVGEPVVGAGADESAADEVAARRAGRFARGGWGARAVSRRRSGRGSRSGRGRRVVGVKIGASQLAAAVVVDTDGGPELVELARRPLADGVVVDGEVRDGDALANALRAFFDEEGLPKKDVRIGISSNRIGVRTFDIAGIDDDARFDNAVRFRAHEVLPVAVHESVLDYRVLEERSNEAGESTRRVLLVVAPRDQIEPYVEVAGRAGIKLAGIDLEALGLLRAFVDPRPFSVRAVDDTATVVVAIGHESSTLLVAGAGTCEFTRVFDWGGGALQEAIATALEVHPAEAATILRHLSLSGPGRQLDGLDEVARARAVDAVRLRLTPFARELVSSLQFYQTQPESLGIGEIVITGGTSHLEGLGETLHQMIGVNVRLGDPLGRVVAAGSFDPAIETAIGSMAVPIGLAIDDISTRSVNLLPSDAVKTRSMRSSLIALAAPVAAAVPLVALGVLYMGAHGAVGDRQAELDAVAAQIAALPKPQGPEIDARVVGDEAARATAVANVLGGRLAWDAMFRDISRVLPGNVWLKSLSAKEPQPVVSADGNTTAATAATVGQPEAPPTDVTMEGYTYSQPDVARLLARLATLPSLSRVTLTSSQRETVGKKDVVRFVIVAALTKTGGSR